MKLPLTTMERWLGMVKSGKNDDSSLEKTMMDIIVKRVVRAHDAFL
jgi:hypothetical protein